MKETSLEVPIAIAGVVTGDHYIYPEETLLEMAKDPQMRYDEKTKTLYMRVPITMTSSENTPWKCSK